jgi:putative endopeptidase
MTEKTLARTRELLEAAGRARPQAGTVEQQAADYYAAYLDEAAIEAKGVAPLTPLLERIGAVDSKPALARLLGEELRADVDALNNTDFYTDRLFGLWVTAALNEPATNTPYCCRAGWTCPTASTTSKRLPAWP